MDPGEAHSELIESCIRFLVTPGLRVELSRSDKVKLLDYVAASWPSHLAMAQLDRDTLAKTLENFLAGPCVLSWT